MSQINLLSAEAPHIQCVLGAFKIEINYFWIMFHYSFTKRSLDAPVAPGTSAGVLLNGSEARQIVWWWTGSERALPSERWICPGSSGPSGSLPADLALRVNHWTKRASHQRHFDPATNHSAPSAWGTSVIKLVFLPQRSRIITHRDSILPASLSGRSRGRVRHLSSLLPIGLWQTCGFNCGMRHLSEHYL